MRAITFVCVALSLVGLAFYEGNWSASTPRAAALLLFLPLLVLLGFRIQDSRRRRLRRYSLGW
jgi:hypothetical protein